MDCKSDINLVKQENQDLEVCFEVRVKVENDIEWPIQLQTVLGPNEKYQDRVHEEFQQNYQTYDQLRNNLALKADYQENISYKEFKHDFQTLMPTNNVISKSSMQFPHEKYQEKINYEELKQESFQTCMLCGKYFADSYSLLQHNLIHLKVPLIQRKLLMCEHCPKYYKKKKDLKNHILINHLRQSNHQIPITKQRHECMICKKTYSYKHWFSHMKEVHGEAKFKCKECNLSFKSERTLKRHNTYVHEGVKKYKVQKTKCPKCPAILDCKYALTTHLRNCHSNETYKCHICNSKLKCRSYLLAHIRRVHHNDGIIHECEICGGEFKSERYMKIHIKNAHIKKES